MKVLCPSTTIDIEFPFLFMSFIFFLKYLQDGITLQEQRYGIQRREKNEMESHTCEQKT